MTHPRVVVLATALVPASGPRASAADATSAPVAKGSKYVFGAAGGCACHTLLQGARAGTRRHVKFDLLVGVIYAQHHADLGDGNRLLERRAGERDPARGSLDGSKLFPVHPHEYFANIADDETEALVAYLRTAAGCRPCRRDR